MDFSLQPEDNKSAFSVSPSSATNSYFTEQALRAGFLGNEMRRVDFGMGIDPMRDAIHRQLEKERIRQEIIAAEIVRRRELEMEVRRELAMERELALRRGGEGSRALSSSVWAQEMGRFPNLMGQNRDGIGADERTAKPSGNTEVGRSDRLPFQRPVEAKVGDNGNGPLGQVMFLAKPTSGSLIGTKRKLAAVGASELNPAVAKKKAVKDWNCALCKVSATSEQGLKEHLEGRKHRAREADLKAKKTTTEKQPKELTSSEKILEKENPKSAKKEEANVKPGKKKQKVQEKKKKFRYWCEDCGVGTHSQKVMFCHMKGKKHQGRVQSQKQNGGSVSSTTAVDDKKLEKEDALEERNEEVAGNVDVADDKDQTEEHGEVDDTQEAEEKREIRDVDKAEGEEEIDNTKEADEKEEVEEIEEAEDKEVVEDMEQAEEKGLVDGIEDAEKKEEVDNSEVVKEEKLQEAGKGLEASIATVIVNEQMDVSATGTRSNDTLTDTVEVN